MLKYTAMAAYTQSLHPGTQTKAWRTPAGGKTVTWTMQASRLIVRGIWWSTS